MNNDIYCRGCRTILKSDKLDLNGAYTDLNGKSVDYFEIFFVITNVDIGNDTFSKFLCQNCTKMLISAFEFRNMVQGTHMSLSARHTLMSMKKEEVLVSQDVETEEANSDKEQTRTHKRTRFKEYRCSGECTMIFQSATDLKKHLTEQKGTVEHSWRCDLCCNNKLYETKVAISSHLMQSHKEYICNMCNKIAKGRHGLYMHQKKEHNIIKDKKRNCPICGKLLANHDSFRRHMKYVHEKEQNFACHMCGKKFSIECNLKNHIRIHTDDRPYVCTIAGCNKRFRQRGTQMQHELTHTDEKKYSCDICKIKLKTKYYLKEHRKIHINSGCFKCEFCNMAFAKASYLNEHKKKRHYVQAAVNCTVCGKFFANQKYLNSHMDYHNDPKYACQYCEKKFVKKDTLKRHIRDLHETEGVLTAVKETEK